MGAEPCRDVDSRAVGSSSLSVWELPAPCSHHMQSRSPANGGGVMSESSNCALSALKELSRHLCLRSPMWRSSILNTTTGETLCGTESAQRRKLCLAATTGWCMPTSCGRCSRRAQQRWRHEDCWLRGRCGLLLRRFCSISSSQELHHLTLCSSTPPAD